MRDSTGKCVQIGVGQLDALDICIEVCTLTSNEPEDNPPCGRDASHEGERCRHTREHHHAQTLVGVAECRFRR